jgi:hypothetical protein
MFQTHQQNLDQIEATRRKLELPLALHDEPMGKLTKRIKRHEALIRSIHRNSETLQKHKANGFPVPQCILDGYGEAVEYNQACITFIRFLLEV